MKVFQIILLSLVLAVAIYVALSPRVVYAPVPRVVLFFLISLLAALLFGAEAMAKLELQLPGFSFVTAGAAALCLGTLWILTKLAKPEEMICVFHVFDEQKHAVNLEWQNAYEIPLTASGLTVTSFAKGNTLVLIFPEQVTEVELLVREISGGRQYAGTVRYAGTRQTKLFLGTDLT